MQWESRNLNVGRIKYMICHEKEILDAVEEAKFAPRGHTGGAPSGHSFISDPTAGEAIRRAEELPAVEIEGGCKVVWPERWLKVVSAVRAWCLQDDAAQEIYRSVISCRDWLPRSERRRRRDEICRRVHIERSKFYRTQDAIFMFAEGFAKANDLL